MTANPLPLPVLLALAVSAVVAGATAYGLTAAPRLPPSLPLAAAGPAAAHALPFGRILPERPMPAVPLTLDDGTASDLGALTRGHWTIVQLMFAGCTSTCPVEGAIFQRASAGLTDTPVRLLSITFDPVGDTPAGLKSWPRRFEAGPAWRAAVPDAAALGPLVDALQGRGTGIDVHGAAAFLIDPEGRLAYVTEPMPSPETLEAIAREASGSAPAGG